MLKKTEKMFFISDIIASQNVAINCLIGVTNSYKILHITQRRFFNPNCLQRNQ